ncbi:MAG: M56 family metallopeptidase [Bryobacteraceae bacterium]
MTWSWLVTLGLKGALAVIAAWCVVALLERRPAAIRHWAWLLCMMALVAVAVVPLVTPEETTIVLTAPLAGTPMQASRTAGVAWRSWAVTLWLSGAVGFAARVTLAWIFVWWQSRRATPLGADVYECASIPVPAAFGLWHYRILLPSEARQWPASQRHAVLLHERAHAERKDGLTRLVAQAACCLHWFNPLVWLAERRMSAEREHACDDRTLVQGVRASDYAEHLIVIARRFASPAWAAATVSMAGRTQLEQRIRAILAVGLRRDPVTVRQAFASTLLAAGVLVPLAVLQAQTTGSISGVLSDPSRAVVPGAELILEGAGAPVSIRTGPDGSYAFDSVAPGRYTLRVRVPGFVEGRVSGIDVRAGAERRVFPQLVIGEITEQVDVVADRGTSAGAKPAPSRVRVGGHVDPVKLIAKTNPEFPVSVREAGVRGAVRLAGTIGTDGAMHGLLVVYAPHPDLGASAVEAVSKWRWEPAKLNGKLVAVSSGVTVNFEFEGAKQ